MRELNGWYEDEFGAVPFTMPAKTLLNAVKTTPVKVTDLINKEVKEAKEVTFSEMSKNNPKELLNLLKTDKDGYKELYKKEFGVEPTI